MAETSPPPDATAPPAHKGARARARASITAEINAAARRQLADVGAAALSLRAIARELGMASSAVYRYVSSRDELLTTLIIDAYDDLGSAAEAAAATVSAGRGAQRWHTTAIAIRRWALDHPHEWALLYGTPVPGYAAPESTIGPGTRVSLALLNIVGDAAAAGTLQPTAGPTGDRAAPEPAISAGLRRAAPAVAGLATPTVVAVLAAWTQLFGLVSFEIFGQTTGLTDDDDRGLFDATVATMAAVIGLR